MSEPSHRALAVAGAGGTWLLDEVLRFQSEVCVCVFVSEKVCAWVREFESAGGAWLLDEVLRFQFEVCKGRNEGERERESGEERKRESAHARERERGKERERERKSERE